MLVTVLAVLLTAGPVCQALCPDPLCGKVCGPDATAEQLKACEVAAAESEKDAKFCKAQFMSLLKSRDRMAEALGQCLYDKWKCEAKPAKKPTKKKAKKAIVVVPPAPQKQEQAQSQKQEVIVNIIMSEPRLVEPKKEEPKKPVLGVGVRGAVGLTCNPAIFGVLGVRGRLLPAHLGLEVNTQFAYGHSAQLMVYPIQGPIAWHLDFGGLLFMREGPQINLLAGTGVEVQVVPHFSITADWRMTMPRPFNLGDSLLKSQLMLGLMLHTW